MKPQVSKTYNTEADIIYLFEERSAIVQYGCGVSRKVADEIALKMIRNEFGDKIANLIDREDME